MIDIIRNRRSIRRYLNKEIPNTILEELKETALRSPTSRNRKEWLFWFGTDTERKNKLTESKAAGSKMIESAPLAIVIGAKESECDVWVEDCSIAAILLQLTAQTHQLGSVGVQIRKRFTKEGTHSEDWVKSVLKIADPDIRISSIIAIGYPDENKAPIPSSELKWDSIKE